MGEKKEIPSAWSIDVKAPTAAIVIYFLIPIPPTAIISIIKKIICSQNRRKVIKNTEL